MSEQEKTDSAKGWNIIDIISISFAVTMPLIIVPISLFILGEVRNAILVASASWLIVAFYESPLEEQLKDEIRSRAR